MKKILFSAVFAVFGLANAQEDNDAFSGASDLRLNIGANIQNKGTGIHTSLDFGLGESFSLGAQAGYLLGVSNFTIDNQQKKPAFTHRIDVKARVNAHLGDVIGFPQNIDVYPGLNLGLKNFGGHLGARMFFGKGFGVFVETQFPIARYNREAVDYQKLNNQFAFILGASIDLTKK